MLRFRNEPGVLIKMLEQGMLDINVQDLGGCHIVDDDLPAHERVRPRANLPNSPIKLGASAIPSNHLHAIAVARLGRLGFEYFSKFYRSTRNKSPGYIKARAAFGTSPDSDICSFSGR